jgi:hypothetical protein
MRMLTMPLNLDAIGSKGEPVERSWTLSDAMLYARAVGAGDDPLNELNFTTENTFGVSQQVLPTMGVILGIRSGALGRIGTFNPAMLVHAERESKYTALSNHRARCVAPVNSPTSPIKARGAS